MIIHISRVRFDNIQSLSYRFPVRHPRILTGPVGLGDNEIHLLDNERALCKTCGKEFDSIIADTPADYEAVKDQMRKIA